MKIRLKQGLAIITVVDQENLTENLIGSKAVFSTDEKLGDYISIPWAEEQLSGLAQYSLSTGKFNVVSLKNPQQPQQQLKLMIDPFLAPHELVILGGGHISRPLAALGHLLGYRIIVVDDRNDFLSPERFPQADKLICCDFNELEKNLFLGPRSCVVIVTRGHRSDLTCLRQMLNRPLAYLGVIGSRRKIQMLKQRLLEEGAGLDVFKRIYMPIGIDIGAQTPEEIAVSIAAEIIKVRRGGRAASLKIDKNDEILTSDADLSFLVSNTELNVMEAAAEAACNKEPAALATIIETEGSSPRKAGSRMLVLNDGRLLGTIGGGTGEAVMYQEALRVLKTAVPVTRTIFMNAESAAAEGMICGGSISVFIEPANELARLISLGGADAVE